MIKFGEWLPDQPDFQDVGATEAKNVIKVGFWLHAYQAA